MNKNYFRNLCIKEFSENINDLEKEELKRLIKKSDEHLAEYEILKSMWKRIEPIELNYELNINSEWEKFSFENKAENKKSLLAKMSTVIKTALTPRLKPALAFGTVLIVAITLFLTNPFEKEALLKTLKTGNGEKLEVLLSDGSTVTMNNGSEIKFLENFHDDKREIILTGEAFFSIKKDGRPFVIKTENAVTMVLGTKFNVWARENETRVIVKEGKVSLADNIIPEHKVFLEKNQTSTVVGDSQPTEIENINADYSLGWMDGKIVFNNTAMEEVLDELQRHFNKTIKMSNVQTNDLTLTGKFDNEEIDSVLAKICLALDLKYVEEQNIFNLTK
jgi:ferric-dicitrate binding protein FerR (iron transport regulator)